VSATHLDEDTLVVTRAKELYNYVLSELNPNEFSPDEVTALHDSLCDVHVRDGFLWLLTDDVDAEERRNMITKFVLLIDSLKSMVLITSESSDNEYIKIVADLNCMLTLVLLTHVGALIKEDVVSSNVVDDLYSSAKDLFDVADGLGCSWTIMNLLNKAFSFNIPQDAFYKSVKALPTLEKACGVDSK
jgi:hypothetical protein